MHKEKIMVLLLGIVLVAGCIGGGQTTTSGSGNGVEIINFTSISGEVYSGSKTTVTMGIENQGESIAPQGTGGIVLLSADDWTPTNVVRAFSKALKPSDTTRNMPADKQIEMWTLTAPPLGKGQSKDYTLMGRLYYDYATSAFGSINVYPESEASAAMDKGETLQSSTWSVSRGPIRMDVSVAPDPVVVTGPGETFVLQMSFTNDEDGVAYKSGTVNGITADGSDTAPFSISTDVLNMIQVSVKGLDGSKNLNLTDRSCLENIQLVGGTASIICDVNVTKAVTVPTDYSVTLNATYGYYTDKQLKITARGK